VLSIRIRINFGRLDPDWQKTPENINKLTKGMGHQWWGGQFYFSFPPKCSKLRTVLQMDDNDAEMKKKFKFLTVRLAIKSLATDLGAGVHVLEDG
jgi:hypothetical protein